MEKPQAMSRLTLATSHLEDEHQAAYFTWASHIKEIRDLAFHVPNGGNRNLREATRLKKQGVRPGVSDIFIPIARGGYFGLWIELKIPLTKGTKKAKVSASQKKWISLMLEQGYEAQVCYGWPAAKAITLEYLKQKKTRQGVNK